MQEHLGLVYPTGRTSWTTVLTSGIRPKSCLANSILLPARCLIVSSCSQTAVSTAFGYERVAQDSVSDGLSSEEVALLIAAKRSQAGLDQVVSKSELAQQITLETLEPRPYPAQALPGTTEANSKGTWTLTDDNLATMVLRNAMGKGDEELGRRLMSMNKEGGAKASVTTRLWCGCCTIVNGVRC